MFVFEFIMQANICVFYRQNICSVVSIHLFWRMCVNLSWHRYHQAIDTKSASSADSLAWRPAIKRHSPTSTLLICSYSQSVLLSILYQSSVQQCQKGSDVSRVGDPVNTFCPVCWGWWTEKESKSQSNWALGNGTANLAAKMFVWKLYDWVWISVLWAILKQSNTIYICKVLTRVDMPQ